jgi:hypothetical protein
MKTQTPLLGFGILVFVLASCGDDPVGGARNDAGDPADARLTDGQVFQDSGDSNPPDAGDPAKTPPSLGPQIDRAGRAAISPLLIGVFETDVTQQKALEDAYSAAADPATWATSSLATNLSIAGEIAKNIAIYDAFDTALTTVARNGCGNELGFSYQQGASILSDDQIYVDTSGTTSTTYLALEIEIGSFGLNSHFFECGGRAPSYDVIDSTYSILSAGTFGFDSPMSPLIHDGVSAHADVSDTEFPFLGPPHN